MQGLEEKSSAPVGDRTPIVQPVVRHYTVANKQLKRESNYWNSSTVRLTHLMSFSQIVQNNELTSIKEPRFRHAQYIYIIIIIDNV
jgi:hypothetical protein